MKELYVSLKKALARGISNHKDARGFNDLTLLKCTPSGVGKPEKPTRILSSATTLDGESHSISKLNAWPQFCVGPSVKFLIEHNHIYLVEEEDLYHEGYDFSSPDPVWAAEEIEIYDVDRVTPFTFNLVDLHSSVTDPFDLVDFGYAWALFHPYVQVFFVNTDVMFWGLLSGNIPIGRSFTSAAVQTACAHRGRLITGGFGSSYINEQNSALLEIWNKYNPGIMPPALLYPTFMGKNYVQWSSIGGGDLLWSFYPEYALEGMGNFAQYNDEDFYPYLEEFKKNTRGFMPMDSEGWVLKVLPLGKNVVVYSEDAIHILFPADTTFGKQKIASYGIPSKGAVGGDDSRHLFLDTEGELHMLTQDGIQDLGYRNVFEAEVNTGLARDIRIHYLSRAKEFVIFGGAYSWMYTEQGLTVDPYGHNMSPTTLHEYKRTLDKDGGTVGATLITFNDVPDSSLAVYLETDKLNFGNNFYKQITQVNVDGEFPFGTTMGVSINAWDASGNGYTIGDPFVEGYITVNVEEVCRIRIAGIAFVIKLIIYIDDSYVTSDYRIRDVLIGVQQDDKRFVRGVVVG